MTQERAAFAARPVGIVGAVTATVLTALSGRYGYHRDELYFLVAGRHPAWGYVDQPPLTPLLARASTAVFGDTLVGLRVVATLSCVATVVLVALIARELGGSPAAQTLAAGATAASAFVLAVGHMVATAGADLFLWLLLSFFVLRLLRTGDGRLYLAIGATVGVGLLNKDLIVLPVLGILAALLAVGPRRVLRSPWLIGGIVLAALIAVPNLWWQATHGWPELTVAGGISGRDGAENRIAFVPLQLVYLSPLFVPVWIAGIVRLWRELRWARSFAVLYPLLAVVVLALGGKAYYVLPPLLVLTAAGAEPVVRRASTRTLAALVLVAALINVVATLPVLPPSLLNPVNAANQEQGEQVGWPALTRTVADAWRQIPDPQRSTAVIFTANYGEAGAIDRYGPGLGLPAPYSGHMSYADWGPPPDTATGPVLLVHQQKDHATARHFTACRQVATVDNGAGLDNGEQHAAVELCAGPPRPWSALWPELRHFYG